MYKNNTYPKWNSYSDNKQNKSSTDKPKFIFNESSTNEPEFNSIEEEIEHYNNILNSKKYISNARKIKITNLLTKLEDKKKEDEKDKFPVLGNNITNVSAKNTCWSNLSTNIKSNKGVEELNKNVTINKKTNKNKNKESTNYSDYDDEFSDDDIYNSDNDL